ncbi:MAG: DHH family phosphoesterase [Alphaproteobacteria bacterium]|nr:MAG: DHH family phosphoesterase [Alphaproteobacteria bacterium]
MTSLKENKWIFNNKLDLTALKLITETYDISELEAQFIVNRKLDPEKFFNGRISHYLKDVTLADVDKLVERLAVAIKTKERVAILGDYDVDGITSTVMLISLFRHCNIDYKYVIPNRSDGYGHSLAQINKLDEKLVIMLDCGSSLEVTNCAKDICIIDHHQVSKNPDVCAFVNPYRFDVNPIEQENYRGLCTAGLVFIVIVQLVQKLNLDFDFKLLLDLVALATIGDCMELINLNRDYVKYGLQVINSRKRLGLKFLIDNLGLRYMSASQMAFYVCPCINAAGRISSPDLAVKLLCTQDIQEAHKLSRTLIGLNERRKMLEKECLQEALKQTSNPDKCIIVKNSEWNAGLVGIIAGKIKDKFELPTFVLYKKGDLWKGSARSTNCVNIGVLINKCILNGVALEGGGHRAAGGISIPSDKLEEFIIFVQREVKIDTKLDKTVIIDYECQLDEVQSISVDKIHPFGIGNKSPVVVIKDVVLENAVLYKEHIRMLLNRNGFKLSLFAFNWFDLYHKLPIGQKVDILVTIQENNNFFLIDMSD